MIGFPAAAFDTNCFVLATGEGQECVVIDPGIGVTDTLSEVLRDDPLWHAHQFTRAADREVVAFIAAGFAWGNVRAIDASLQRALRVLGSEPARELEQTPAGEWRSRCRGLVHRRIHPADAAYLFGLLGEAIRRHGSLGGLWEFVDDHVEEDILAASRRFLTALTALSVQAPRHRGRGISGLPLRAAVGLAPFGYGVPNGSSPMKRLCLFLRWMARPADGVDLGLWPRLAPARLIVPLDVHVLRTARELGLTERRDASMRTALEVTRALARVSPGDPCRYDFAMVRAGIAERRRGAREA